MSQPPVDDDFQDRIQRILNEKKKDDLREQYGMSFQHPSENMPPEVEGEWLDHIAEFERQFENAGQISVRERVGNPEIRPLAQIPDSELEVELDRIFEILDQHNIAIDFLHAQDDRDVYRFITEELLDEMIDDMHIPGMISHFIYEEFHPNDDDDISMAIDEFIPALFEEKLREHDSMWYTHVSRENMHDSDGTPISFTEFQTLVDHFYEAHSLMTEHTFEIDAIQKDGDYATAMVQINWQAISRDKTTVVKNEGTSEIKLARSVYGGWDIVKVQIPGWKFKNGSEEA